MGGGGGGGFKDHLLLLCYLKIRKFEFSVLCIRINPIFSLFSTPV